jgi:hypothetical protein
MRRSKTIFREVGVLRAKRRRRGTAVAGVAGALALTTGCGSKSPPTSPPCEQDCKDGVALRALRETMKYAYNAIVQNRPIGPQDGSIEFALGGTVRVFGFVTSDPLQGVTKVEPLTYVFTNAKYLRKDEAPEQNYDITIDGTLEQRGVIAVQPSSTTALTIETLNEDGGSEGSTRVSIFGEVYDPPLSYDESGCTVVVTQSGNNVSGHFCGGRKAGFSF